MGRISLELNSLNHGRLARWRHFTYVTAHSPTFPRFTYVTTNSTTLPLLHLRHSSFSNPSFASPTSQDFHIIHLASPQWTKVVVNTNPSCINFANSFLRWLTLNSITERGWMLKVIWDVHYRSWNQTFKNFWKKNSVNPLINCVLKNWNQLL